MVALVSTARRTLAIAAFLAAMGCAGPERRAEDEPVVVHHYVQDPWPHWGMLPYWGVVERTHTFYAPSQPPDEAPPPKRRLAPLKRLHVR